jgi:phosphohistidine phosphatase
LHIVAAFSYLSRDQEELDAVTTIENSSMQERPDYYYNQSAVVPYRGNHDDLEILMITSRKKKRWVIPKGIVEPDLTSPVSAAKEALEEAGLLGRVSPVPVGTYQYKKWGGICNVEVYTMEVDKMLDDWPENHRDREWLPLRTAITRVRENKLKRIIQNLPSVLQKDDQADRKQLF